MSASKRQRSDRDTWVDCSHCGSSIQLETARSHRKKWWSKELGQWTRTENGQNKTPAPAQNPDNVLSRYAEDDDGDVDLPDAPAERKAKASSPEALLAETHGAWLSVDRTAAVYGEDSDSDEDDSDPRVELEELVPADRDSDSDDENGAEPENEKEEKGGERKEAVFRVRMIPSVGTAKSMILLLLLKAVLLFGGISMRTSTVLFALLELFVLGHNPAIKPSAITHYTLNKTLGFAKTTFDLLVVCPKCWFVRKMQDCIITRRVDGVAQTELLRCDEFPFLHHPHPSRRDRCNAQLVRAHDRKKGLPRISAVLAMPYRPILAPLARLLQMPGFEEMLESWRPRFRARLDTDPLVDIHDGRLWREFQRFGGEPLLEAEGTIAFCMWGDWIQPFVKTMYSLGAIMLAIANLPRSVRFDRANIILVQAFPGGSEKVDCQQLLRLLVEDLVALWNGITIATAKHPGGRKIRCFLLQCLADAPGVRKLFAFVGINAICGCIKCKVKFPSASSSSKDKKAKRNWNTDFKKPSPARTRADMESASAKYSAAKSPSERKEVAKAEGSKFCVFLQLVYLNVVRACPIEAMHNLYEGTGKVILALLLVSH